MTKALRTFGFVNLFAVSSAAFALLAGAAHAAPLLKSSNAVEPQAAEQKFKADKALKRKRLVDVDPAVIAAELLPQGADKAANRAEQSAKLAGEVTLDLFSGVTVTLRAKHVEDAFAGGVVWNAAEDGGTSGILVVNGGRINGSIEKDGRSYLIEPTGRGNEHRVREIDTEALPNDKHMEISLAKTTGGGKGGKGGGGSTGGTSGGTSGGTGSTGGTTPPPAGTILEINLLAAYTARANTLLGGVPADKIALDVAIVNQGYSNSGVPLHLNLVGVTPVSPTYDEKAYTDYAQPLYDLTSGTVANFGAIRDMRTSLAADLVTMYADRSEYCGIAWVGVSPSYAFSAIKPACNGSASLAHELGHNMGLRHDRYVEAATGSDVYNYGYVSTAGRFRDIMSYNNECSALGFSCPRVTYYSNPNLSYNGYALGIPQGTTGAADATRKLSENATAVAAFR